MVRRFANADVAVMAERAVTGIDADMAEGGAKKTGRVVAIGAILGRWIGRYVVGKLADANPVVVARVAAVDHPGMIVSTGGKGAGRVAGAAIQNRRHVRV